MRWLVVAASLLTLAGCGLDREGLEAISRADGGGAPGRDDAAAGGDSSLDGAVPDAIVIPPLDGAPGSCVASIPTGWGLVAYEPGQQACPPGYSTSYDAVTDPQAAAGACTCDCSVTKQPSCDTGSLHTSFGMNSTCNVGVLPLFTSGGCTQLQPGGPAPQVLAIQPLAATGGQCAGAASGDTTKVSGTQVRYCVVPAAGAEAVCNGSAPAGFSACIAAPGDVACPAGSPFTNRLALAQGEVLVCSACSSCSVQGTCTSPTVTFYGTYLCGNKVGTFDANGACTSPSWSGTTVNSITYQAQVAATCTASGTAPTFQAIGPQTLCCR